MLSKITMSGVGRSDGKIGKNNRPSFEGNLGEYVGVSIKYLINQDIFTPMEKEAKSVLSDLNKRIGVKGQFLNWVHLPEEQFKRVNYIYNLVDKFKNATGNETLTILGIGGSKHTVEHLVNLSGFGEKNIKFYSDIDPLSFNKFKKGLPGESCLNSNFLVVSKSGTTFEIEDAQLQTEKALTEGYKAKRFTNVEELVNRHFVAVTDAGDKSKLRRTSNEKGYLGDLFVHDDVGGRYSALDDHGLFTLAYAGMKKSDMIKMLEGASEMSEIALNPNLADNIAMQRGIFYADSVKNGINDFIHALFGRLFEGGTENWLKQFHGESLKDTRFVSMKGPDGMHYDAEAIFDPRNKNNITVTAFDTQNLKGFDNYTTYTQDIVTPSFAKIGPTSLELLKINKNEVAPEAIGAWTQLKGFETIFKGMLRRETAGISQPAVLDEVLQPSVEAYKKSAFNGNHVLIPGR